MADNTFASPKTVAGKGGLRSGGIAIFKRSMFSLCTAIFERNEPGIDGVRRNFGTHCEPQKAPLPRFQSSTNSLIGEVNILPLHFSFGRRTHVPPDYECLLTLGKYFIFSVIRAFTNACRHLNLITGLATPKNLMGRTIRTAIASVSERVANFEEVTAAQPGKKWPFVQAFSKLFCVPKTRREIGEGAKCEHPQASQLPAARTGMAT
jgi:hypothetical protein